MTVWVRAALAAAALLLVACADDSATPNVGSIVAPDGGAVTGQSDVLRINADDARAVLGAAATTPIFSQLRYNGAEQSNKNVVHRAEYFEPSPPPADTVVEYGWRVFLPETFPISRLSVNTAAWYDANDNPVLQQIIALNQLWIEFQASPKHEQIYKPHPAGTCVRGQVHTMTASVVWSTNPDKGRIQLWCDNRELFRYRGATLARGAASAPRLALGLSYRGSGRGVAAVGTLQQASYGDLKRRVGGRATVLAPPPPLSMSRVKKSDPALNAVAMPQFETMQALAN